MWICCCAPHRCVQRIANAGIQLLSSVGQLQPRRDSSDVPAGLATFAAVESLFQPAVADASALNLLSSA